MDCKAKITYVVVQKRHHTRFFPDVENPSLTERGENILVGQFNLSLIQYVNMPYHPILKIIPILLILGTVVDKMVCHPTEFDFFLCSHAATQVQLLYTSSAITSTMCRFFLFFLNISRSSNNFISSTL